MDEKVATAANRSQWYDRNGTIARMRSRLHMNVARLSGMSLRAGMTAGRYNTQDPFALIDL